MRLASDHQNLIYLEDKNWEVQTRALQNRFGYVEDFHPSGSLALKSTNVCMSMKGGENLLSV